MSGVLCWSKAAKSARAADVFCRRWNVKRFKYDFSHHIVPSLSHCAFSEFFSTLFCRQTSLCLLQVKKRRKYSDLSLLRDENQKTKIDTKGTKLNELTFPECWQKGWINFLEEPRAKIRSGPLLTYWCVSVKLRLFEKTIFIGICSIYK